MTTKIASQHPNLRAWFALALIAVALCACLAPQQAPSAPAAHAYVDADRLFHSDPRWLGGDAAISVPLSPGRILWLFGDTFVASPGKPTRATAAFVRNTIAVEGGDDPRTAAMSFAWRHDAHDAPASFFPERGKHWYWPGGGIRIGDGPLVILLDDIVATPGRGLGFANDGYALAVIDKPDEAPNRWAPRIVEAPASPFDAVPGAAVVRDGDYIVALALRQKGTHAGALVRYRASALATGDISGAEWWLGETRGWIATKLVGKAGPLFVIDDAGAECSLHWDARTHSYIHVASYGFGASVIGVRSAPALTGPWSAPRIAYRPSESDGARPFVYAGKAHPELSGPSGDDLVVTYVASSFEPKDLLTPAGELSLYWPHFVVVPLDRANK